MVVSREQIHLWNGRALLSIALQRGTRVRLNGRPAQWWYLQTDDVARIVVRDRVAESIDAQLPPESAEPASTGRSQAAARQADMAASSEGPGVDTWTQTNGSFLDVWSISVDPNNANHLWVAGNHVLYEGHRSGSVVQWQQRVRGNGGAPTSFVVDPTTSNRLYHPFELSADGGQTWTAGSGATNCAFTMSSLGSPGVELVGTYGNELSLCPSAGAEILRSTDQGASYSVVAAFPTAWNLASFVADPQQPSTIYAAVSDTGVARSTNDGATWTVVSNSSLDQFGLSAMTAIVSGGVTTLLLGNGAGQIYRSVDGGVDWTVSSSGLPNTAIYGLAHDPTNQQLVYTVVDGHDGFYRSVDGGQTWQQSVSGMGIAEVNSIAVGADGTVWVGLNGLFMSTNQGQTWQEVDAKAGNEVYPDGVAVATDGTIYVTSDPEAPWKSSDHGQNWAMQDQLGAQVIPELGDSLHGVAVVSPSNPQHLYLWENDGGSQLNLYATTNAASSWNLIAPLPTGAVGQITVDPVTDTTLYAAMSSGLYANTSGGTGTWATLGFSGTTVLQVEVDPTTPRTLFATTTTGVWKSVDGGATWSALAATQTTSAPVGLTLDATNPLTPTVYVGTSRGEQRSTDGGAHWMVLNQTSNGLPGGWTLSMLAVDPSYPALLLGANGSHLLRSDDGGATWVDVTPVANASWTVAEDPTSGNDFYAAVAPWFYATWAQGAQGAGLYQDATNPLLASLQGPDALVPDGLGGYQSNPFTITAMLTNTAVAAQQGVQETLTLPPGLSFTQGVTTTTTTSQTISIGALTGGSGPQGSGRYAQTGFGV